jgi:hypothetical protein
MALIEPLDRALALLKRQAALEAGLRQPGGIRITEERELYALREQLQRYPQAVGLAPARGFAPSP